MSEFYIGQIVKFKEWDEMVNEYGTTIDKCSILNGIGNIKEENRFTKWMKHLCGTTAKINEIRNDGRIKLINFSCINGDIGWGYTVNMIKPIKDNENKMENLWEFIAEKRGLKIGEEFRYSENDNEFVNRIYKNRLEYKNTSRKEDEGCRETSDIISKFIAGEGTIEKLPPKFADPIRCEDGKKYRCILSNGNTYVAEFYSHNSVDLYRRKAGNMFALDAVIPQEQIDKIVKEMKE